jgi:hypothetical protein
MLRLLAARGGISQRVRASATRPGDPRWGIVTTNRTPASPYGVGLDGSNGGIVTRRTRPLAAAGFCCLVLLAACSNSTNDTTPSADPGTQGTGVTTGDPSDRDTFVALSGVPGVSDDAIAYSVIGTKAGNPLGICILDCYVDGIEAYFAFRNSEGGIFGRDLVIDEILDDEVVQNQQRSLDLISGNDAFGAFSATLLASGWGDLDDAGVPTYGWGIHATEAAERHNVFPHTVVRCATCPRPAVPYIAAETGATKAASIGYGFSENSKSCTNMVAESFERWEAESGVELVYTNDDLTYGLPNGAGPEVTAMKDAGVDFISTCLDLNAMKSLAQEIDRQGMDDVVLYHPNSYDTTFIAEGGEIFEGDVVLVQFRPFEASPGDSSMGDFLHWIDETGAEPSELSMVGWMNAATAFDGLLAAGPEFDRAKVVAATNAMTDYTFGGLSHPLNWGDSHTPFTPDAMLPDRDECSSFVRVEDGAFVPFGDPDKPWLCWAEGLETYEPTEHDFS